MGLRRGSAGGWQIHCVCMATIEPTHEALRIVDEAAQAVDALLHQRFDGRDLPEGLLTAMRYATVDGGKRLRPALVFASCDAVGGNRADVLSAAAAVELVHAFSLVHDDLPAMDDDDLRRGRPTVHVKFGEAMAILAGDALLAEAFALLLEDEGVSKAIVGELARATEQMIAGQVVDSFPEPLENGGDRIGLLEMIHRRKTGALIRASCRMGALLSVETGETLDAITRYSEAVGLMYQIVDDLLDVEQTSEQAGKRTGKDALAGKLTYPGELGVEGANARAAQLHDDSMRAIEALGPEADGLRSLSTMLVSRTR
jgi:geranylgeranyl diphosphate synthase, type II